MAYTLFDRIIDRLPNVDGSQPQENQKISVTLIRALASEINRGVRTPAEVAVSLNLSAQQQADWGQFLTKMSQHPNKMDLSATIFDWLALAEAGYMPEYYRNEASFWSRIDAEIAAAGA